MRSQARLIASALTLFITLQSDAGLAARELKGLGAFCADQNDLVMILDGIDNIHDARTGDLNIRTPLRDQSRFPANLDFTQRRAEPPPMTPIPDGESSALDADLVKNQCRPLEFAAEQITFTVSEPDSSQLANLRIQLATGQVTMTQVNAERSDECRHSLSEVERLGLKDAFAEPVIFCSQDEPEALSTRLTIIGSRQSQSVAITNPSDSNVELNLEFAQLEADLKDLMAEVMAAGECTSNEPEREPLN